MVKHNRKIRWQQPTACLSVFDHLVGLALKGLRFLLVLFSIYFYFFGWVLQYFSILYFPTNWKPPECSSVVKTPRKACCNIANHKTPRKACCNIANHKISSNDDFSIYSILLLPGKIIKATFYVITKNFYVNPTNCTNNLWNFRFVNSLSFSICFTSVSRKLYKLESTINFTDVR